MTNAQTKHFEKMFHWIELESQAERERFAERRKRQSTAHAEKRGETLLDLVIQEHDVGLGGYHLISLVKRNRQLEMPWNRLRVGSPVMVSSQDDGGETWSGVVSGRTSQAIQIAMDEWPTGEPFRIDLSADEVTRRRMQEALRGAMEARGRTGQLRDILMGEREPTFHSKFPDLAEGVNASQQAAIAHGMMANDVAIIHGPPGTGKTTTVVHLIQQCVAKGMRVLATAPSNTGVDNLLEKLAGLGLEALRIGHPARVHPLLQSLTLDAMAEMDPAMKIVRELMREAEQVSRKAEKYSRAKPPPGYRQEMRKEVKRLRQDARELEKQIIASLLDRAEVLCATTTYDPAILGDRWFDVVVIDEACQCTEPGCWPVVLRGDRLIIAGDPCQLPPTVLSKEAAREGFAVSLMERLMKLYGERVTRQLTVQYRMHETIMRFSSGEFYAGQLTADVTVAEHLLSDLPGMEQDVMTTTPLLFIDSAGANWDEELEPEGESKRNPQEARLVAKLVERLLTAGVAEGDIAVIAPYAAQVRLLRSLLHRPGVEVDTVDGFQGREKEVVVISLVRSNAQGEVGFLSDTRRMNVALTRARRKLIVVGDSATLSNDPFYARFVEYVESLGAYDTVWSSEYQVGT